MAQEYMSVLGCGIVDKFLLIDLKNLQLSLIYNENEVYKCCISASKNGLSERFGSEGTPLGLHVIVEVYDFPKNTVFVSREPVGIYSENDNTIRYFNSEQIEQVPEHANKILSVIFRLSGQEFGRNFDFKNDSLSVDSFNRYIYIHGVSREERINGFDSFSSGCILLKLKDLKYLSKMNLVNCPVLMFFDLENELITLKKCKLSHDIRLVSDQEFRKKLGELSNLR